MTPPVEDTPEGFAPPTLSRLLQLGIVGALAVYLVYWATAQMNATIYAVQAALQVHSVQTVEMTRKLDVLQAGIDILIQIEKVDCLHRSKDLFERGECYDASKR
jgi:hypothetical protein